MSKYKYFETVGDLIAILQELPKDTNILRENDNFEQHGYQLGGKINIEVENFNRKRRQTYDAFDGTPYSYDCILRSYGNDEVNLTGIII